MSELNIDEIRREWSEFSRRVESATSVSTEMLRRAMRSDSRVLRRYGWINIIGGAAISLGKDALTSAMPIIICAVAFVLCYFTSISNLTLVVAGVVIALVWMWVSEHGHV